MKRLVDSVEARYGRYQRAPDFTGSSLTLVQSEGLGWYKTCKYVLVCVCVEIFQGWRKDVDDPSEGGKWLNFCPPREVLS